MHKRLIFIFLINVLFALYAYGQVRIRLFSSDTPESALFSVTGGSYELVTYNGQNMRVNKSETVLITRFNGLLAVKKGGSIGFTCDSLSLKGTTGNDFFSLRINDGIPRMQFYSGDFQCFPDLGTLVMINKCNIESYIAGVVKAEGGSGRNKEYIKSQAILARTYMYKYFDKHLADRYNVCDNTHCQVFNGVSSDSLINRAALETSGLVILGPDSTLIISAFHSNCGGETTTPENVWLTSVPYLKSVADPYCITSRSAKWEKRIGLDEWTGLLKKSGYSGRTDKSADFTFMQKTREQTYHIASFNLPLAVIRSELNLRSTFFSVLSSGDSIILRGRGYGHGVGLCQEGAMTMAIKGSNYRKIINFYYSGVIITDIKNALILKGNSPVASFRGGL
jgi:stage II sporulation protein D